MGEKASPWLLVAKILMGLFGLVSLSFGIWYEEKSVHHEREHKVADLTGVTTSWTNVYRKEFAGLEVNASVDNGSISILHPNNTMTSDFADDEHPSELPNYESLVYRTIGVPAGFLPELEFDGNEPKYLHRAMNLKVILNGSLLAAGPFPLVVPRERRCKFEGGHRTSRCNDYAQLKSICVQVTRDMVGNWRLHHRNPALSMSYGCNYDSGNWRASRYEDTQKDLTWAGYLKRRSINFEDLVLEVRSSMDPYFYALELTQGVMNFGMGYEEEQEVGIILIIVGICLSCPVCCSFCIRCCRKHRQRHPYRRQFYPPSRASNRGRQVATRRDQNAEMVGMKYMVDDDSDAQREL